MKHSQSSQDQENCDVDLNNHVDVVLGKESCHKADGKESGGWDEHCQNVAYDWSAKSHFSHYGISFIYDWS